MKNAKSRILRRALALLSKRGGWGQGDDLPAGRYCALTALGEEPPPTVWRAVRCLREVVGLSVIYWNDNPKRTKREVLAAFRRAIKIAERRA